MSEGLLPRSPYERVHNLVYFGRMLDKIRLHAAGKLPAEYISNLGIKFDEQCLHFLGVGYASLCTMVIAGASDEEAWEWCLQHGRKFLETEIFLWNNFMLKYGWRDEASEILQRRLKEGGWENRTDIQTMFDYIDLDEGRGKEQ